MEKKNTVGNCCESTLNFTKMKKLSRNEMKNVLGGNNVPIGEGCIDQYVSGCRISGNASADEKCCSGYKCEMNATNTGTICV